MSDYPAFPAHPFPAASQEDWLYRVESVLKGADFDKKLVARSHDGIRINPLYQAAKTAIAVTGSNAGKPWRVMARVDHPVHEEAASLALQDLEAGADALALVFRDSLSARGFGLACATVADLDATLARVRLDLIQIRLDPSPDGFQNAKMLASLVEKRKFSPAHMTIDFGLDPVGHLVTSAGLPQSWQETADQLVAVVLGLMERGFKGPFLSIDLRPAHEAGASEGQELAMALGQAVLYLRLLEAHGIRLDRAVQSLSFVVPVDADQFMGIAKLRALRKLWANVVHACGLEAPPPTVHAETSWRMLTTRDSHVNILRATVATFAAGIGGADSVTVLPFTSALGLPDAAARRLARNTSIVLQEESNLWRVADPAAGAGGYETLTDELAAKAWMLFQDIEREGGLMESLVAGKLQARIAETAKARTKAIAMRKEPITGTSEFANLGEVTPDVLAVKPFLSGAPVSSGLKIAGLPSLRSAETFEALRDHADAMFSKTGKRPQVMLLTLGPLSDHGARLAFMRNAFEAGGFEVSIMDADNYASSHPRLCCLVGTDAAYADAETKMQQFVAKGQTLWLAGRPGGFEAAALQARISRFVFAGCDMVETLTEAQNVSDS